MNQLSAMRIFAKVAESLSFANAAKELHVSTAMVTRGIATLEAHLNVQLLNRTTRAVSLTDAGLEYWQGCKEVLALLDTLEASVCSATRESAGSLKVAAHDSFVAAGLSEVMAEYRAEEPRVNFDLTVFESTQELAVNNYDVCFAAERRLRDSKLVCRPLAQLRDVIVAAPKYLARRGAPRVPTDLSDHDVLVCSDVTVRSWEFCDAYGSHRVPLRPIFCSSSLIALVKAAQAGIGIARLPASLVDAPMRDGTLVPLLQAFELENNERTLWMLYSGHRYMTPRVRRFVDFAAARCRRDKSPRRGFESILVAHADDALRVGIGGV
ncbi:LysR family transcriptional regulator [Paraburkholderia sp. SARCC-3016]|uniref:LysR family transcriptional regulator n=1 Tax=Paraburkholderia sp. SARCC-3016 TaxID=3058611 RepID=UPI002807E76F|nr:LysR family transcriptional regulator [Paraburkholderia sp. SARCC-3016]MDQ7982054.1 LysR family transcriptional regulator [Paraburkholderia sp. SARCC-3016]